MINWSAEHQKSTVSQDKVSLLVTWWLREVLRKGPRLSAQADQPPKGQSGQIDLYLLWIPRGSSEEVNTGSTWSMSEHLRLHGVCMGAGGGEREALTAGGALSRHHGCERVHVGDGGNDDRRECHPPSYHWCAARFVWGPDAHATHKHALRAINTQSQTCTCPRSHEDMY